MKLFQSYGYAIGKHEATGGLFRHILDVLQASGMREFQVRFHFEECKGRSVSPVKRLLKRFPSLGPFAVENESGFIVSNLDGRWEAGDPERGARNVDLDILGEIADGIPKAFPFVSTCFIFEKTPWTLGGSHEFTIEELGDRKWSINGVCVPGRHSPMPGLALESQWHPTRREIAIRATVQLNSPQEDANLLPDVPASTREILNRVGNISSRELQIFLEKEERQIIENAQAKAAALKQQWEANARDILLQLQLPHDLPEDPVSKGSGLTSPHRSALIEVFKPRGYAYESRRSGQGCYVMSKLTNGNNRLSINFDVGSWSHKCTCMLMLEGPSWLWSIFLLVTPRQKYPHYGIADAESWKKIVENIAVTCDHYEATLIPEIQSFFPATPAWFVHA